MSSYPGGKAGAGIVHRIINLMPPHRVYIEPFLGSGAVMRAKKPASINIGVDIDSKAPGMDWIKKQDAPYLSFIGDALDFLKGNTNTIVGDELIYCDPPYLMSTRTDRRLYKYEFCSLQHRELLRVLAGLPCMVMISGYRSLLYKESEIREWSSITYDAMTRGGTSREETLWFNFKRPTSLHDYSFLGEGFRDRERLKRKKQRWTEKLRKMPALERQALLAAIADTAGKDEGIRT